MLKMVGFIDISLVKHLKIFYILFNPFIIGQKMIGPLMAMKLNIPLCMYGEHQAEYGNILSETNIPTMDKNFSKMTLIKYPWRRKCFKYY